MEIVAVAPPARTGGGAAVGAASLRNTKEEGRRMTTYDNNLALSKTSENGFALSSPP